ncbi:hypothetical protein QBC35DRAFT_466043 [Podospora australis]|uniref:Uncharacterized protein n=1 Tax=Podospora australis TaxID=1536484 RepID=A0AAN6WN71_9PEZI|nr:hypothetical protein QBC35DRAFT_466043 [Podospora australis]
MQKIPVPDAKDVKDINNNHDSLPSNIPFQFSLPRAQLNIQAPPPLPDAPRRLPITTSNIVRPRPTSPTREARLLAQHLHHNHHNHHKEKLATDHFRPKDNAFRLAVPTLEIGVYPVRSATREFVPTNRDIPVDLVFSLRPPGGKPINYIYALTKILVAVPYGTMPERDDDPKKRIPLLTATADPPVPTMLSNMRLNVLRRWGQPDEEGLADHVVFELIPRQQPGMPFAMLDDASFRLPRAQIARYDGEKTRYAYVKVLYEVDQKPPRANFSDGKRVPIRAE